jgi:hypothetical protein
MNMLRLLYICDTMRDGYLFHIKFKFMIITNIFIVEFILKPMLGILYSEIWNHLKKWWSSYITRRYQNALVKNVIIYYISGRSRTSFFYPVFIPFKN